MIYQPREDSYLLEKEVKKYAKDKSVLDMGCGSGIQGKAVLSAKARSVIFADIEKKAIKELKIQGFNAIESDLFSNIKGKFDLIVFNPPYLPLDAREDSESRLATTGGKRGDEIIIKFMGQAKSYLSKKGMILIVVSSLTPKKRVISLLEKLKLKKEILSQKSFFMEKLEVWKIKRTKVLFMNSPLKS